MPVFMFSFGFETPAQHRNNTAHGWDDEDARSVFIEADSADDALAWGREIAENFVRSLWSSHPEASVSWSAGGFAHWIETDPERVAQARGCDVPLVRVGQYPALTS